MRNWLAEARSLAHGAHSAETAEIAKTPPPGDLQVVSAVSAVSATALRPEEWAPSLRRTQIYGVDLNAAADILDALTHEGVVAEALALGWDPRELLGVWRFKPHDSPYCAGLIFSLWPGDTVTDVRRSGCLITYSGGRHVWLRRPLPLGADTVACLPWELPT